MNDEEVARRHAYRTGWEEHSSEYNDVMRAFLAGAQHARKDCEAEIQRLRSALIKLMEDDWVSCENLKSGEYVNDFCRTVLGETK